MTRIFTFLFLTLLSCFQLAQADVTVTFNVNMNHMIVSPSGVYVAGGTIGGPGTNELTDPDNDGIYSGSVIVPDNAFVYYVFTNGNCGDYSCKERMAGQSCSDPANFDDRSFQAGTSDMTINTCFGVCSTTTACASVDVTFSVNMQNEVVSPDGVFLAGGLGFGQPGDIPMLDTDNDGTYTVTRTLPTDYRDYYTFTNGNCPGDFNCKEQIGGQACASPENFNDRLIVVGDADQSINTCFGLCTDDGTCDVPMYSVTFQVDMNSIGANPDGVNMGSSIDGWSGNISLSDPDADGIYSITLDLLPGFYEYKFINGPGWDFGQIETVPIECDVTGGQFQNRGVTVINQDVVIPLVCFSSCTTECPPPLVDVHFRVDMAIEGANPGGINMGSNIDGWSGNISLSQVGSSTVWEVIIPLTPGAYEYKFINGPGWANGPAETVPLECDVTGGAFQNRGITVEEGVTELILPAVCFSSCDVCPVVGCMDPAAHNYRPRAEVQLGIDGNTFYWDDVTFVGSDTSSPYCATEVTHFAGDAGSEVNLTINTVDANTMEVIVESPDATDPVDVLIIPGGSGAAITIDDSQPNQIKGILTWATPPTDVILNVLWSKESFPGNWQLSQADVSIPFGVDCTSSESTPSSVLLDFETPVSFVDFGNAFSSIVVDPTDDNNMVVETNKVAPAADFAGTFTDLSIPIPFTLGNTTLSVRVWSPQADIPVLLKIENAAGGPASELIVNTTVAMQWETLEFDFSNDGNFNSSNTYDRIVIFFDFGTAYNGSECETCEDGIQNGDEKGVDCGGKNPNCLPCNEGCTDATAHNYDESAIINNGSCETCDDGEQNGDETGRDCGGSLCAPCNDMCHDAFSIKCGDTVTGNTDNATIDSAAECGEAFEAFEPGVWYKISGDNSIVTASLCNSTFDTQISVYEGSCGNLVCVDGNDDSCEEAAQSEVEWTANKGTEYYILVHGLETGDYELSIDCYTPLQITVNAILGVPANGAGTGSVSITVTGGDTDCEEGLLFDWIGPNGYEAFTEDISGLTEPGVYNIFVDDCLGNFLELDITVPTRGRGRGRRGGKTALINDAIFNANPNPFSQQTFISFNLANEEQISLDVFDITGKLVANVFNGMAKAETNYQFQFGNDLPTGTYIAALTTASGETRHIKLVVTH